MTCPYMMYPKGHQKTKKIVKEACGKKEFKDGFCSDHQPVVAAKVMKPAPNFSRPHKNSDKANPKFVKELTPERKKLIESDCKGAPDGGGPAGGQTFKGKGGSWALRHETRPGMNFVYFYSWTGSEMEIFAIGSHTGKTNQIYSVTWFDGSSATIDLKKSTVT